MRLYLKPLAQRQTKVKSEPANVINWKFGTWRCSNALAKEKVSVIIQFNTCNFTRSFLAIRTSGLAERDRMPRATTASDCGSWSLRMESTRTSVAEVVPADGRMSISILLFGHKMLFRQLKMLIIGNQNLYMYTFWFPIIKIFVKDTRLKKVFKQKQLIF